ncbi:MAG: hypothetical protein JSW70_07895 [Syntrophobacterales bacterium]|nr:MAG: hypothetical protein JSW70_07895 [Syntrophobacterales bacterium]
MKLNTMAAVMSFVSKIENESAEFYQDYARRYPKTGETFSSFIKENKRFEKVIKQTYFGVITDTIEACYSFEGLDADDYEFVINSAPGTTLADALRMALEMEDKIEKFYLTVAELSYSLMADIPVAFKRVAKKRQDRKFTLQSLLETV